MKINRIGELKRLRRFSSGGTVFRSIGLVVLWASIPSVVLAAQESEFSLAKAKLGWHSYKSGLNDDFGCSVKLTYATNPTSASENWTTEVVRHENFVSDGGCQLSSLIEQGKQKKIVCLNPDYWFEVKCFASEQYGLESCLPRGQYQKFLDNDVLRESVSLFPGVLVEGVYLKDLFESDGFEFTSVTANSDSEHKTVEVEFVSDYQIDDLNRIRGGKIRFLPDSNWIMKSYRLTEECLVSSKWHSGSIAGEFEYDLTQRETVPQKFVKVYDFPDANSARRYTYEFTNVEASKSVDNSVFYLSHYGIPEPPFARRASLLSFWNMIFVSTLVALGSVIYYRFRISR